MTNAPWPPLRTSRATQNVIHIQLWYTFLVRDFNVEVLVFDIFSSCWYFNSFELVVVFSNKLQSRSHFGSSLCAAKGDEGDRAPIGAQ